MVHVWVSKAFAKRYGTLVPKYIQYRYLNFVGAAWQEVSIKTGNCGCMPSKD